MAKKKKKKKKRLDQFIRKPTAKPTVYYKQKKKAQKSDKVGRKSKHKKKDLTDDE